MHPPPRAGRRQTVRRLCVYEHGTVAGSYRCASMHANPPRRLSPAAKAGGDRPPAGALRSDPGRKGQYWHTGQAGGRGLELYLICT
ncbi:hypothetical protein VFPFJ_01051 [Purpureocillium lilacinum]|uniref:Uncharacterized protein n=1 Tax=Purpureocillium lilacinum TaxID=33203 RepID=A0A179HYH4_PURLI|nr:hypothetical protein VFPFJ_01051 [Purpureocillium lilacinum]OAQ94942.1 hypothetical protein VFPFJ_01051 [Purpureocillium lilacinum]